MRPRSACSIVMAAFLACAVLAGCGGSSDEGESYAEILRGLKQAALTGSSYDAVSRAEDLDPTPQAAIDSFCETNQEMLLNQEAGKATLASYYISRIKVRAERELPFVSTGPVNVAVGKFSELFDLASFDPDAVRRYAKACFR